MARPARRLTAINSDRFSNLEAIFHFARSSLNFPSMAPSTEIRGIGSQKKNRRKRASKKQVSNTLDALLGRLMCHNIGASEANIHRHKTIYARICPFRRQDWRSAPRIRKWGWGCGVTWGQLGDARVECARLGGIEQEWKPGPIAGTRLDGPSGALTKLRDDILAAAIRDHTAHRMRDITTRLHCSIQYNIQLS